MPSKEEKTQIKQFLKLFFDQEDNVKFYFLKKSKISPELEYIIPFKTRKSSSTKQVKDKLKKLFTKLGMQIE